MFPVRCCLQWYFDDGEKMGKAFSDFKYAAELNDTAVAIWKWPTVFETEVAFLTISLKLMASSLFSYFTKNVWKNVFPWVLKVLFSSRLRCYFKGGQSDCQAFSFLNRKPSLSDSSRVSQREEKSLEQNLKSELGDWRSEICFGRSDWYFGQNPSCTVSAPHYYHRYQCSSWFQVLKPAGQEEAVQHQQ